MGDALKPQWIKADKPDLLRQASLMLAACEQALAARSSRGRLESELTSVIGTHRSAKLLRGLAKLMLDRCTFEPSECGDVRALRWEVFLHARTHGPLALEAGLLHRKTADDVLADFSRAREDGPAVYPESLYTDLPESHVLTDLRPITAEGLLHRYNLALVQAVLRSAVEVEVRVEHPSPYRLRQLMHAAKFHRLIHRAQRQGGALVLTFDGPDAIFAKTTRYGLDLANFMGAVPRLDTPWTMRARVLWGPARESVELVVSSTDGLVSPYPDTGGVQPPEVTQLIERWPQDEPFQPSFEVEPIELGGRGLLLPDLVFSDGRRRACLEVAGWWRKDWLARRLEGLRRYGPGNVVLAVSRKLCAERAVAELPMSVIGFSSVLPVREVREAIAKVAC